METRITKEKASHTSKARPPSSNAKNSHGRHSVHNNPLPFPYLHNSLEVQSSPIQLATRSLSARSTASSVSSLSRRPGSAKTKGSSVSLNNSKKPTGRGSVRSNAPHSSNLACSLPEEQSRNTGGGNHPVSEQRQLVVIPSVQKGFNIASHLEGNVKVDRSSGSLSPDVDQFLKDIGAEVRPLTPDPGMKVADCSPRLGVAPDASLLNTGDVADKSEVSHKNSSNPHKVVIAANLGAVPDTTETVPDLPSQSHRYKHATTTASLPQSNGTIKQYSAAVKIQRWYRRMRSAQYASVQSMLEEKREELNRSRAKQLMDSESTEIKKKQRRAAKMQAARKMAIEELNKKREEKRLRAEKISQEEVASLKARGKIKKSSCKKPTKVRVGTQSEQNHVQDSDHQVVEELAESLPPPLTSLESSVIHSTPSKHGSTYSDILETLKLLEEVPEPLVTSGLSASGDYLSAENLQKLAPPSTSAALTNLSEGKLTNILAYLDQMEKADQDLVSQLSKSSSDLKLRNNGKGQRSKNDMLETTEEVADPSLEAATAAASNVTSTILTQRIELDNKNKTIEMMQKALRQQRELTVYHAKEMEKDCQKKMDLLQTEYESRIQRHQAFIDQLIDDKKVLSERCEQLVKQLREVDRKYRSNLKSLEEKHSTEVTKLKQVTAAADKLRRERWKADETQRIKEATVKSLEPEIQRIIAKGKAEVQKLKALHEAEMMQVDERASRRFVAQMEEVRAQCAEEREHACAHERELARQRYEKMAEQEEIKYQQLRRKLFAEVQQEKNRLADQFQEQKLSSDRKIADIQQSHHSLLEELKSEHARQMAEIKRRHSCEMKDLQERSKVEKQAWEENVVRKKEADILYKERQIREQLRNERDKEIELVITRLEEESASSKEELERAAEARVRRVRDKYEAELREAELSEHSTLEKFNHLKSQVVEHEGELSRLHTLLRQKQEEVERVSEIATKLTRERDSVADIVRQEFADRLVRTEEENKDLKIEMSELRARHKIELEKVGRDKNREMESVHDRVKQALSKKEGNLRSLREQYDCALKRADHLEMLLEQQRKQLLKK